MEFPKSDYTVEESDNKILRNNIERFWEEEAYGTLIELRRYFDIDISEEKIEKRAQGYLEDGKIQEAKALKILEPGLEIGDQKFEDSVRSLYRTGSIEKAASAEKIFDQYLPEKEMEKIVKDYLSVNSFKKLEKLKKSYQKKLSVSQDFIQKKYNTELMPEPYTSRKWQNGFKNSKEIKKILKIKPSEKTVKDTYKFLAERMEPHFIEKLERWSGIEIPEKTVKENLLEAMKKDLKKEQHEEEEKVIKFPGNKRKK